MMLHEIKQYKTEIDTEEEVWQLLNKHCKHSLNEHLPIVRGMNPFRKNYGIIHGAAGKRESANTTNHYTVILDAVLPKEFPKRSKSIICANWKNRGHAKGYGVPYAIIPFDKVKIGICPEHDMFETEIQLTKQTPAYRIFRWNDWFVNNDVSDKSYGRLIGDLQLLLERRDFWDLNSETIEETIKQAYSKPFKLATTATAELYNDGQKHELWIGGKCLAIELGLYRSVMRNARGNKS